MAHNWHMIFVVISDQPWGKKILFSEIPNYNIITLLFLKNPLSGRRRLKPSVVFKVVLIFSLACLFQGLITKNSFAWKPPTHIYLAEEVVKDALDDGKVTLYVVDYEKGQILGTLGSYEVDPHILSLLKDPNVETTFRSGNFGPDAYPDPITGGMVIHADLKDPTTGQVVDPNDPKPNSAIDHGLPFQPTTNRILGPNTEDWLNYLWTRGYEGSSDPQIQAFVLGFLCHAAGDMYIHTFLNYFAGGIFQLSDGDNAARHILFETYIAKRQKGPSFYTVTLPDEARKFIYDNMVDARKGTVLREKLLLVEHDAEFSPPLRFSQLRDLIQTYQINLQPFGSVSPFTSGARQWVKDIDDGLKAWVDFSHNFATTFFMSAPDEASSSGGGSEGGRHPEKNGNGKFSRTAALAKDYMDKHLWKMLGFESPTMKTIDSETKDLKKSFWTYVEKGHEEELEKFKEDIKVDLLDYITEHINGMSYEEAQKYAHTPQMYFNEFVNAPPGKNADARPVSMTVANHKYLHIMDDGYKNPQETWQWEKFPPAFNTIQLIKLFFMKKEELQRVLDDLEMLVNKQEKSPQHFGAKNVMLDGFCHSIDDSMSWRYGSKMFLARNPEYYVQLFMWVEGEYPKFPSHPVEFPPAPGGIISEIDIVPGYLKDYDFKKFKPADFLKWFGDSREQNPNRKVFEAPKDYTRLTWTYEEQYSVPDNEKVKLKKGDQLRIKVRYYYWGYKKEEVTIKIVASLPMKKLVLTPFEKKEKFDIKKDFITGEAKFDIPIKELPEGDPLLGLEFLLNNELSHRIRLTNAYEIKTTDEEAAELEAALAELETLATEAEDAAREASAFCQQAQEAVNRTKTRLENMRTDVKAIEKKLAGLDRSVRGADQQVEEIKTFHKDVEDMTTALGELETQCNEASNFVCEKVSEMKNADVNQQRQDAYSELVQRQGDLASLLQKVIDIQGRCRGFAQQAATITQELKDTKEELDKVVGIKEMLSSLDVCDSDLKEVVEDLNSAKAKIDAIVAIKAKANEIAARIRKNISPELRKSEQGKEGLKKIDGFLKRIDAALRSVQGCPAAAGALLSSLIDLSTQLRKSMEGIELTLKELRQILGDPGILPTELSNAMDKAGLIDYLAKMAEQYINRIKLAQHDAQVCREFAKELIKIPVSVVLPDLRNQPVNQAQGTLQGMNIASTPVEVEKATDPQYEYLVKDQDPPGGREVKIKDANVTLSYYGELDVNAYLAGMDCSVFWGTHPEFDPVERQARCVCNPGMAPGDNGQCIDCNGLMGQSQSAYGINQLDVALQFALMARNCPGAGEWIGHIQALQQQAQCQQIEGQIRGLLSQQPPNVNGADSLAQQALAMGCLLSGDIRQMLNQYIQQQNQQQQQAMVDIFQNVFRLPESDGPVEGGGGYRPPAQVLTSQTIVGYWDFSGSHPSGPTASGSMEFFSNGGCRGRTNYTSQGSAQDQSDGTWTLNGDSFYMKMDQGAEYKGTVQGDSNAFTLTSSNNGWTLNYRRR